MRTSAPSRLTASARHELIRRPVDDDRAGTALAAVAALLCAGEVQPFAQQIEQRDARVVDLDGLRNTIYGKSRFEGHAVLHMSERGVSLPGGSRGRYGGFLRFARGRSVTIAKKQPAKAMRKTRVDAVRNRERVLDAARKVFSAGGPDASLEAVAREAGVGIGTLYRHFPTREALFEAVYRREVQQLADLAEKLKEQADPVEGLRRWMRSNVRFVATKKGMLQALALAVDKDSPLFAYSFDRLTQAVGGLLARAVAAGAIRADISAEDVLRALVGLSYMQDQPGSQKSVLRVVDIFIDGLRKPGAR